MSRALDVAAAWLRVRQSELTFLAQQDETWREMIREGLFRPAARARTSPGFTRGEDRGAVDLWGARPTVAGGRPQRGPIAAAPGWIAGWAEPVIVRASAAQIAAGIEELEFASIDAPLNDTCPISQQLFGARDRVARLRRCGHLCEPESLRRWFTYSVHCPLCRVDIRHDPTEPMPTPTIDNRTSVPPIGPPGAFNLASRLAGEIAVQLRRQNPDASGNFTVEYALVGPRRATEGDGEPGGTGSDGGNNPSYTDQPERELETQEERT
jgi:hypothetical protein